MQGGISFLEGQGKQTKLKVCQKAKWILQEHPYDLQIREALSSSTHSVFGVEVRLTGDEVLCTFIMASPHSHMQRCAEQLKWKNDAEFLTRDCSSD